MAGVEEFIKSESGKLELLKELRQLGAMSEKEVQGYAKGVFKDVPRDAALITESARRALARGGATIGPVLGELMAAGGIGAVVGALAVKGMGEKSKLDLQKAKSKAQVSVAEAKARADNQTVPPKKEKGKIGGDILSKEELKKLGKEFKKSRGWR